MFIIITTFLIFSYLLGITTNRLHGKSSEADGVLEALVGERTELESVGILRSECSDKSLQLLLQHPRIKIVKLPGSNVTGDLQLLTSSAVEELNLSWCRKLTDTGIAALLKTGANLRILHLSGTNVSFSGIDSLTTSFLNLEKLDLSYCSNMTDTGLITFLNRTGGNLRILHLSGTNVSFSGIDSLTMSFAQLKELDLSWCRNVTEADLITFLSSTRGDLTIVLKGKSAAFVENVKSRFPNLNVQLWWPAWYLTVCVHLTVSLPSLSYFLPTLSREMPFLDSRSPIAHKVPFFKLPKGYYIIIKFDIKFNFFMNIIMYLFICIFIDDILYNIVLDIRL